MLFEVNLNQLTCPPLILSLTIFYLFVHCCQDIIWWDRFLKLET